MCYIPGRRHDAGSHDLDPRPSTEHQAVEPGVGWALAGLSVGAGVIHFAMTPIHAAVWQEGLGFAAAGWFQLCTAGVVLTNRATTRFYGLVAVANLAFIAIWLCSRTIGLPFGESPGVAEAVGAIDAVAVALQLGVVLIAVRLAISTDRGSVARLAPAMCAVAALGLATVVITSPDAANHEHSSRLTGIDALDAEIDRTRCDTGFNDSAYRKEAKALGVDTRWAGNPPAVAGAATSSDGHMQGSQPASAASTPSTQPDPFGGRGSSGLDHLVSATGLAATSEIEAAGLIAALSEASEQDYAAWLRWLRTSGTVGHDHATPAATPTAQVSGHGGHVGPQPWVAMTDQRQCDQLAEELALARKTALSYPTAQDAVAAGYQLDTPYLAGIAAHYIKKDILDDRFEITEPEMILYDGNGPDAHVVGLSYQVQLPGGNEPTQGFTGDNDHGHRHIGLCYARSGLVIGDSTITAEDCAAQGGTKGDGSKGWMSHAWVVPGCESPWGVFSAANPVLDGELAEHSGTDRGGCAGSGVRDRYDLDGPGPAPGTRDDGAAATEGG